MWNGRKFTPRIFMMMRKEPRMDPTPDPEDRPRRPPIDFIYRYRPDDPKPFFAPDDWRSAAMFLEAGNALIVRFFNACARGHFNEGSGPPIIELSHTEIADQPIGEDGLPTQMPFAVMLGCADARVPTELLFGQEFNDIFNIRVAGNILAEEGIGSLLYALRNFTPDPQHPQSRSLKLAGVLGHRGCGAVRATIKTFQSGPAAAKVFGDPIGSIITKIAAPPMAVAAELIDEHFGTNASADPAHLNELVEMVVYLNAAWSAHEMQGWVTREGPDVANRVGVVYGVFDPETFRVHALPETPDERVTEAFATPPADLDALRAMGREVLRRIPFTMKPNA